MKSLQHSPEPLGLADRARVYALAAHTAVGQRRKYTQEPYIVHPAAVAALVRSVSHTPEMLAAAWLHDVLEDTRCTAEDLRQEFGPGVARLVLELTDAPRGTAGNRAKRKAHDLVRLACASPQAKTIKLADLIDNADSIVARDPNFASVYMREKGALLGVLQDGSTVLWQRAHEIVSRYNSGTSVVQSHA